MHKFYLRNSFRQKARLDGPPTFLFHVDFSQSGIDSFLGRVLFCWKLVWETDMLAFWRTLTTGFFVRKKHRVIHGDPGFMTLMTLMAGIFHHLWWSIVYIRWITLPQDLHWTLGWSSTAISCTITMQCSLLGWRSMLIWSRARWSSQRYHHLCARYRKWNSRLWVGASVSNKASISV